MKLRIVLITALFTGIIFFGKTYAQQSVAGFHYNKAVELFEKEQYAAAIVEFEKAIGSSGIDREGYREAAEYYIALSAARNASDNALELLRSFKEKYPSSIYTAEINLESGVLLEKSGDYHRAYETLSSVNPYGIPSSRRDELFYRTGHAAFQTGDYNEAYRLFRQVSSDRNYLTHARYHIAYIDYTRGDLSQAKTGFRSIASDPAYAPLVPFYLLNIEFQEGNYPYVVEQGPSLLEKSTGSRSAQISRMLGEAHFHLKSYRQALTYIERYASLGGKMGAPELYIAGYSNHYLGYWDKAVEYLTVPALGGDQLGQNAAFHLADSYMQLGDKKKALGAFTLAASADYDMNIKEEAMFNQGKLQYELGGGIFNEAITILDNYVKMFPASPRTGEARELLFALYFNTKNYDAAYDAIKAIQNPDNNVRAALQKIVYFRGLEAFEAGDYDRAMAYFDEADANRFNARYTALTKFWRAETFMRKGNANAAAPLYREYINLSPASDYEHTVAQYNLGYSYFNLQQWDNAAQWFQRFISGYTAKDEMLTDAWNRMGDISFARRDYKQAIENYDKSLALGTSLSGYGELRRAVMLGLAGSRDRKIEALNAIIRNGKGEYVDDAMFELGRTYLQQDRFNEGAVVMLDLTNRFPQSPFYLSALSELGLIYHNLGNYDQALKYYKQVATDYPNSPQAKDAMLGIQNIYVERNDIDSYFDFAQKTGIETNVTIVERDSLTFAAAKKVWEAGDHKRTNELMTNYLRQYPRGAYRVDALYAVGESSLAEGNRKAAKDAFKEVGSLPGNRYKSAALDKAAAMEAQEGNYFQAAELYKALAASSTQKQVITEALAGYMHSSMATEDLSLAGTAAEEVLASPFLTPELKMQANFIRARYLQDNSRPDEALTLYRTVTDVKKAEGAESRYRIAEILFERNRTAEAEKEILGFSQSATPHQYWLGRAFLLLGDIYMKNNDQFQAKATYQSIVDGYGSQNDGIVEEARRKLESIK